MKHIKEIISYLNNQEKMSDDMKYGTTAALMAPLLVLSLIFIILLSFGALFPFVLILYLFGILGIKVMLFSGFFFLLYIIYLKIYNNTKKEKII